MSKPGTTISETELKLGAADADMSLLSRHCPAGWRAEAPKRKKLRNTYYDTDDLRILKAGCSLRVRTTSGKHTLTFKSNAGSDALHRRVEYNRHLPDAHVEAPVIDDPELTERIGFLFADDLKEVFSNNIDRRVVEFVREETGSRIEAAFDAGSAKAGPTNCRISEVEFELVEGNPADLYLLAMEFLSIGTLSLTGDTKSSIGYALATGILPDYVTAGTHGLDRQMSVRDAGRRIIADCFGHWMANQAAVLSDHHPEGVHQMRVALRRLRSALSLLSGYLADSDIAWMKREVRWISDVLGPARDLDVFLSGILRPVRASMLSPEKLDVLADAAANARTRRTAVMRRALRSKRYTTAALRIGCWIESPPEDAFTPESATMPVAVAASELLTKCRNRVLKVGKGLEHLGYEDRHEVRIALKKLRYANEFFRSLFDSRAVRTYGRQLSGLQDDLGFMNDMAVSLTLTEQLTAADRSNLALAEAGGFLAGWQQTRLVGDEMAMRAHWKTFRRARPYWENAT